MRVPPLRLARTASRCCAGAVADLLARTAALPPDAVPPGAHRLDLTRVVGRGEAALARAAARLAAWDPQRRAGFRVRADGPADALGTTVLLGAGVGPARLWFGCRVVEVLDTPTAAGFTYATLPGHPERGHERFTVTLTTEGLVVGRVQAWSAPRGLPARLAGPLGRRAQRSVAGVYLDALVVPG